MVYSIDWMQIDYKMDSTRSDFQTRVEEIESYIDFLKIVDNTTTIITYQQDNVNRNDKIPKDLHRILIANSFLLLYNLMESTVRNAIFEIFENIKENEVDYLSLSDKMKKIWLKSKVKNLKEGTFSLNTLQTNIESTISSIFENEIIILVKDDIDISGNVDADKIRTLAAEFGFDKSANEKNGANLLTIKNKRNGLAHGNHTFYDVGKDYTVKDIILFKETTCEYLNDMIQNIETYIKTKRFQKMI